MTSRSSSVNFPQRSFTDPFICFHLPFNWSEFIFISLSALLSSGQIHAQPPKVTFPSAGHYRYYRHRSSAPLSDELTCSTQIPINRGIVGARLTGSGDILGAGRLQNLLGPFLPFGVLAMDRDQDPAIFNSAFVTLGFVFRDAHSHERSSDATDRASHSGSSESGHDRAGGDKRTQSRNSESANAHQPSHGPAEDDSGAGTCRGSFRSLGAFLVCKIL